MAFATELQDVAIITRYGGEEDLAHYATLARALSTLRVLLHANPPDMRLVDLAERVDLDKGTMSRILSDLESERLVQRDSLTGHFRLGLGHIEFGSAVLNRLNIRAEAFPVLARLAETSQETIFLGIPAGSNVVYLEKVESPGAIQMRSRIGDSMPLYSTGLGKALLAHLPEAEVDAILDEGLKPRTRHTITSAEEMRLELARIRRRGYSTDAEENAEGVACVGAAVFNHDGRAIATMSIAGPAFRMGRRRREALGPVVRSAAKEVSARMGFLESGLNRLTPIQEAYTRAPEPQSSDRPPAMQGAGYRSDST